ncbi:MAG: CBS domain-containing protein, partial [Candidatus Marinimicrobia bacterium]|nr:CBS domain-containing protein [Candidatus Neomarinimicrobiota bacterium]
MDTKKVKEFKVKDLMVPLSEYATVSTEATLLEVVAALKKAQDEYDKDKYRHRAVLIYDEKNKIVGKVSQHDILRALEPKYEQMGSVGMRRFGFTPKFLQTMFDQFSLWDTALEDICKNAASLKVITFMYALTEGEYVDENASIRQAIHQLVMGHHQSMLVTRQGRIVG